MFHFLTTGKNASFKQPWNTDWQGIFDELTRYKTFHEKTFINSCISTLPSQMIVFIHCAWKWSQLHWLKNSMAKCELLKSNCSPIKHTFSFILGTFSRQIVWKICSWKRNGGASVREHHMYIHMYCASSSCWHCYARSHDSLGPECPFTVHCV